MLDGLPVSVSLSYGKDSMATIHVAMDIMGIEVDRIITADVWATDTIPAQTPEMEEFKQQADERILQRWGLRVEHARAEPFEHFFKKRTHSGKNPGRPYGFPKCKGGTWCAWGMKVTPIERLLGKERRIQLLGIAADETERLGQLNKFKRSPLAECGWTEADAYRWCEGNGLLSPVYNHSTRDGCWFCPKQSLRQIRLLYHRHPELWAKLLEWQR